MNLAAPSFDLANARTAAQACADAYRRATVVVKATDTHCLVVEDADCVTIAFRGTDSLRDWITDLRFRRTVLLTKLGCECEVHAGFLAAYGSILVPLTAYLKKIVVAQRPLFITGHSLGGALAVLAALELQRHGLAVAQVYTFGQPRVGNQAFAALYNQRLKHRTQAVTNEGDPVPLLPTLLMGYRDTGHEVFLKRDGTVQRDPFIGAELFADIFGIWRSWRNHELGLLENHALAEYQERIQGLKI
jgi:predicted lipase